MRIDRVDVNNRTKAFEVVIDGERFDFPFVACDMVPSAEDPVARVFVDPELGSQGFTFFLRSGAEDSVMADHVFSYNREPHYMRNLLLFDLSMEAQRQMKASTVSKNEIARRLRTSASQLARLLDQTNYSKSIDSMVMLLVALGSEVQFTASPRKARARSNARAVGEPASVA
jgi:hypothetical protein